MFTKAPQPHEHKTLILCRDVYHCLPSELAREPIAGVLPHLTILDAETEVEAMESRKRRRA